MDANLYLLPHAARQVSSSIVAAEETNETFSYMKLVNHPLI